MQLLVAAWVAVPVGCVEGCGLVIKNRTWLPSLRSVSDAKGLLLTAPARGNVAHSFAGSMFLSLIDLRT